ncbi:hypothetical protein GXW82_09995 [Streptacidiphilus sp. 4-A2]|nr:hypothetical protein [Streptacidiphilus sp. 4-A2]
MLHTTGDMSGKKGSVATLESVQWIVDQGGRTWVVNLQHDQGRLSRDFGAGLEIGSGNVNARTTVDLARLDASPEAGAAAASPGSGRIPSPSAGTWVSPPGGARPATATGASSTTDSWGFRCAAGATAGTTTFPGTQLEWQCADLSDRYLVQRYGITGQGGNGNQVAQNAYNAY